MGCTSGLGHLLSIEKQVTVATHAFGPPMRRILPNCGVVIQRKAQVVVDQVLARCLQATTDDPHLLAHEI